MVTSEITLVGEWAIILQLFYEGDIRRVSLIPNFSARMLISLANYQYYSLFAESHYIVLVMCLLTVHFPQYTSPLLILSLLYSLDILPCFLFYSL